MTEQVDVSLVPPLQVDKILPNGDLQAATVEAKRLCPRAMSGQQKYSVGDDRSA